MARFRFVATVLLTGLLCWSSAAQPLAAFAAKRQVESEPEASAVAETDTKENVATKNERSSEGFLAALTAGSYRLVTHIDGGTYVLAIKQDSSNAEIDATLAPVEGDVSKSGAAILHVSASANGAYSFKLDKENAFLAESDNGFPAFISSDNDTATSKWNWKLKASKDGMYRLSSSSDGREIRLKNSGPSSSPALRIASSDDSNTAELGFSFDSVAADDDNNTDEYSSSEKSDQSSTALPEVPSDDDVADSVAPASAGSNQSFGSGRYQIAVSSARKQRVEIRNGNTSDGTVIQLYQFNKTDSQSWYIQHAGNGAYVIKNVKSGKVLDVKDGSAYPGAEVRIWTANGSAAQRWVLERSGDGYIFRSALNRNLALDAANGSTANGTQVRLWTANGTAAQRFFVDFESVSVAKSERVLADGTYTLKESRGMVLDVRNGSRESGAAVQSFTPNGTVAQSFYISYDSKAGYYTIKSALSELLFDADLGDVVPGAPVSLWGGSSNSILQRYWRIEKISDGRLKFINAANGQVLGLASTGATAQAVTVPATDGRARAWSVEASAIKYSRAEIDQFASEHVSDLSNGTFILNSSANRTLVFDVENGSTDSGVNVRLFASNMTPAQKWVVSHDSKGYVTFKSQKSGKALDVSGGTAENGRNVQQYQSNGTYAQKWIAVKDSNGTYRLISALNTAYALESAGSSATSATNIQIGAVSDGANQSFYLIDKAPAVAPCENILPAGYYALSPVSSRAGRVLDAANGATGNGTNVQLYDANGTLAQLFSFQYVNGYYRIINLKSGKPLDVAGGNLAPGGNVQIYASSNDNANALFSAKINEDGSYTFINKATGYALDILNAADGNGANVQVWLENGGAAQKFRLVKSAGLLTEGTFNVVSQASGSLVLDVANGSTSEGNKIQLFQSNGTFAQKWYVRRVDNNVYEIESLLSGKLLSASGNSLVQTSRASNGSTASQRWTAGYANGAYILKNLAIGKVLNASGSMLSLAQENGSRAQAFTFTNTDVISSGTYSFALTSNSSLRLDVSNGSTATGAAVQAWASNGTVSQTWDVRANGDGTFEISSVLSGKVLDVENGNVRSGARVRLWERNGSAAQRWRITYDGGKGGLRISPATNGGLVLGTMGQGQATQLVADGAAGSQRYQTIAANYVPSILGGVVWKGANPMHYTPGREGNDWSVIVIHISESPTLEGIDNTFWGAREATAHYGVGDTRIHQYVNTGDTAWAVGNWFWNLRSVSIEHVGTTAHPPTYQTLNTSARLIAALARSKGWRSVRMGKNLNIHKNYSSTSCPATLDVNWLYAKANEYLGNGFTTNPAVDPW